MEHISGDILGGRPIGHTADDECIHPLKVAVVEIAKPGGVSLSGFDQKTLIRVHVSAEYINGRAGKKLRTGGRGVKTAPFRGSPTGLAAARVEHPFRAPQGEELAEAEILDNGGP